MSEKSAKELKKLLFNDKKNGFDFLSDEELETCNTFAEGYKDFLFKGRLRLGQKRRQRLRASESLMNSASRSAQAKRFMLQTEERQSFFALRVKSRLTKACALRRRILIRPALI